MPKSTLILAFATTALGLSTVYFQRQHNALMQNLASNKEQCTQEVARLQSDHQARLNELQQHLLQGQ